MTLVAGPPVEVQVRDLVVSLYTNKVAVGTPEIYGVDFVSSDKSHSSYTQAIIYTYREDDIK